MASNEQSTVLDPGQQIQNANRAVYSGWQASGRDGLTNLQFASPPVATRNGLAPASPNRRVWNRTSLLAPLGERLHAW